MLGWRGPGNQKANKGTIVHKLLEIVALAKKNEAEESFEDDICGTISVPKILAADSDYVNELLSQCYTHYTTVEFSEHDWKKSDWHDCKNWSWTVLNNPKFNPLNLDIVDAEKKFRLPIKESWAKLDDDTYCGISGIIDVVHRHADDVIEVLDWKTGQRKNWNTGKKIEREDLKYDPQVRMYHYAAHQLFPEVSSVLATIYWIRDGGPYTVCLTNEDLPATENLVKDRFQEMLNATRPPTKKSWKCTRFCHQGKTTFEGCGDIKPLIEWRDKQFTEPGQYMTKCQQLNYEIDVHGVDYVIENYQNPEKRKR